MPKARSATSSSAVSCPRPAHHVRQDAHHGTRLRPHTPLPDQRAARQCRPPRQPARAADPPRLRRRRHHHGADRISPDVRLELDLHRHRAARDRHRRHGRAGNGVAPRHAGRPVDGPRPCRDGNCESRRDRQRPGFRRPARRPSRGRGPRHRHASTSPMAACSMRSSTRTRSVLRSRADRGPRPRHARREDPPRRREQLPSSTRENPAIAGVSIVPVHRSLRRRRAR